MLSLPIILIKSFLIIWYHVSPESASSYKKLRTHEKVPTGSLSSGTSFSTTFLDMCPRTKAWFASFDHMSKQNMAQIDIFRLIVGSLRLAESKIKMGFNVSRWTPAVRQTIKLFQFGSEIFNRVCHGRQKYGIISGLVFSNNLEHVLGGQTIRFQFYGFTWFQIISEWITVWKNLRTMCPIYLFAQVIGPAQCIL